MLAVPVQHIHCCSSHIDSQQDRVADRLLSCDKCSLLGCSLCERYRLMMMVMLTQKLLYTLLHFCSSVHYCCTAAADFPTIRSMLERADSDSDWLKLMASLSVGDAAAAVMLITTLWWSCGEFFYWLWWWWWWWSLRWKSKCCCCCRPYHCAARTSHSLTHLLLIRFVSPGAKSSSLWLTECLPECVSVWAPSIWTQSIAKMKLRWKEDWVLLETLIHWTQVPLINPLSIFPMLCHFTAFPGRNLSFISQCNHRTRV